MKFSSGPCPRSPRSQTPESFRLSFQGDFLKVTALKRSVKEAMNSFFRNATLFKALYKENYFRNVICNGLALVTFKIYQRGFLKVATIHPVSVPRLNPLRKAHR